MEYARACERVGQSIDILHVKAGIKDQDLTNSLILDSQFLSEETACMEGFPRMRIGNR